MNLNNNTYEELQLLAYEYIRKHRNTGGTSEFDHSINDISRASIVKFKELHGSCFLGEINHYECDRRNPDIKLIEFEGQKIFNFDYGFMLPSNDEEVIRLINEHNKEREGVDPKEIMERIIQIHERIVELKGDFLIWS
ncbi:hypothetical protein [Dysgonomonas sp. ZJ709]|uniref:hypothetical protein n=1 Tax=Dysgonomonas sp. ZJ709 TaxID=2709797 RepID=UPI0013EB9208|nr:hypothetical protein [Dysgonomonas sp. ZJ709]